MEKSAPRRLKVGPEFRWVRQYYSGPEIYYSEDMRFAHLAEFVSEGYAKFAWDEKLNCWVSTEPVHLLKLGINGEYRVIGFVVSQFHLDMADDELEGLSEDQLDILYEEYSPSNNSHRLEDGRMALTPP